MESGLVMRREGRSMIFERAASADGSMRLLAPEAVGSSTYKAAYKNGDAVFLSGNLDDAWTQKEWDRFYGVAKWLVNHDFRVVINPVAMLADVRATVQDDKTKVI
ncbi:MAG TPA: hypothetical protein VLC93_08670, partial [Myxococcota bacterium]|nr:hypothetical protein [Myxococcota bacterium]